MFYAKCNEWFFMSWRCCFWIFRVAEDVWYSCWRSAHCDRGERDVASCNWWVCTCESFCRNQCFSPVAPNQGSHASYRDQLLPSQHALCTCMCHFKFPDSLASAGFLKVFSFFLFVCFLRPWAHVENLRENMKCFNVK